ncbi:MAG TPA: outer membrane beta-barrel protein [Pyrinomonadaceae bacterium]|jgi:hypothetical protein
MKKNLFLTTTALIIALTLAAQATHAQREDAPKTEVGVFFTSLTLIDPDFSTGETRPGVGARLTYNLTDNIAVEGELNIQPERDRSFSAGGDLLQGQFGVKAGKRYEKFGIYAKARPGFVSLSNVGEVIGFDTITDPAGIFVVPVLRFDRETYFSTDLGGVLELYPSRRILARFDIGDTIIRYNSRTTAVIGPPASPTFFTRSATFKHNFQFSAGIGFRF